MDRSVRNRFIAGSPRPSAVLAAACTALAGGLIAGGIAAESLRSDPQQPRTRLTFDASSAFEDDADQKAPAPRFSTTRGSAGSRHEAGSPAFALVRNLTLHVPARRSRAVAYHEASFSNALEMRPRGRCVRNENRTKFTKPPPTKGPRYAVMSSRGRGNPATSAVDIAVPAGEPVLSPVTGTVARVKRYRLYARYPDLRLVLDPVGERAVRVVLLHLTRLQVRKGSRVLAGITRLGRPRSLPFRSQINDYAGPHAIHIHLEVKRRGSQARPTSA